MTVTVTATVTTMTPGGLIEAWAFMHRKAWAGTTIRVRVTGYN